MKLFRNQASVLITLFDNDLPVNANVIAGLINTSLKTVKKEIDDLNFVCLENGCEILSYPGSGYMIEIRDSDAYDRFVDTIKNMFNRNLFYHDAQDERVSYIVRLFLIYRNMTLNDLIDYCYCSESSIRRDLKFVREKLEKLQLALVNRTNKGISLIGDEWHLRMALMHARFEYMFKNKVFIEARETAFEDVFLDTTDYRNQLLDVIENVLKEKDYILPFDSLMRFSVMLSLSITRNVYSDYLNVSAQMRKVNIEREREIVRSIYDCLNYPQRIELSDEDEVYLSIFLKSIRLMRYSELLADPEKEHFIDYANGFMDYLKSKYDVMQADTFVLFKDLCSIFYMLYFSSMLDSHVFKSIVNQQLRDGLFNLDLCALLYDYVTVQCGLNALPEDVAYFYHAFVSFSTRNSDQIAKKILVVAEGGRLSARSMASLINARNTNFFVNYIPMEFGEMRTVNTEGYDGVITDIEALKTSDINVPVLSLSFFRNARNVSRMSRIFVFNESETREFFPPENLFYANGIETEEDIYRFISENVLNSDTEKDSKFLSCAKKLRSVYSRTRNNNIYLVYSPYDCYGRDFLKIVCLNKAIMVDNYLINRILVFNIKSENIFYRNFISTYIGYLIHNRNMYISNDKDKDYQRLFDIISND